MLKKYAQTLLLFSCAVFTAQATELTLLWTIEGKFNMPESAAYDVKRNVIYVSNVNHYAKDNNGFISRVSADGEKLELEWMSGLHSPTGLAVYGDTLYAVDFDALVVIDLESERIVSRIPAEDASQSPVLNDVVVSAKGEVFVTGSRSRSIYQKSGNNLKVWLKDDTLLSKANGLLIHKQYLLYGGEQWHVFDMVTKQPAEELTALGKALKDIDGITHDNRGGFIATLIDDPRLWSLAPEHPAAPLVDDEINGIDLQMGEGTNLLFIPRVGNSLSAYTLTFR